MIDLTASNLNVGIACTLVFLVAVVLLRRSLRVEFGKFHAELKPNGGSSMRDAVDRIEHHVKSLDTRVAVLEARPTHAPVVVSPTVVPLPPLPATPQGAVESSA